jgi:hypothetical protein
MRPCSPTNPCPKPPAAHITCPLLPIPSNRPSCQSTMFLSPPSTQSDLSTTLIQSGALMFLGGLLVGLLVYPSRYPRITLYAHIEGTSYGLAMLVVGLLVDSTRYVGTLSGWECLAIWTSQVVGWPMWLSQLCQCFWGTNQMNKIVPPPSLRELRLDLHPSLCMSMLYRARVLFESVVQGTGEEYAGFV